MVTPEVAKNFRDVCSSIRELEENKINLIRRTQWGEITFENIEGEIDTIFWLVRELQNLPTHLVPESNFENATQRLSNIRDIFDEISRFSLSGDPSSLRDEIANRFRDEAQRVMSTIGTWLPLLALRAGQIENWAAQMKTISADATKTLQDTKDQAASGLKDIAASVEAARAAAGEAGAAEFTEEFRREAETTERRSLWWLAPTGVFALFALTLSVMLMLGLLGAPPKGTWEAIYQLGGRVIAISVLFYAAVWSGRIVLANMHLASVNKHRAVSLQTLKAFHQAAGDPVTKDAVVLEAARAVYENVTSGYVARQSSDQGGSARTLELIKNVSRSTQDRVE